MSCQNWSLFFFFSSSGAYELPTNCLSVLTINYILVMMFLISVVTVAESCWTLRKRFSTTATSVPVYIPWCSARHCPSCFCESSGVKRQWNHINSTSCKSFHTYSTYTNWVIFLTLFSNWEGWKVMHISKTFVMTCCVHIKQR